MRTWLVRLVAPLILVSICAHAQDADAKKKKRLSRTQIKAAKRAFRAGQQALKKEAFGDAIVEFKKAYEITKDGVVMGQVAIAFEKAGDYERALEAIKVYRDALPQSDRGSVDEMISRYGKMIAAGKSKHLTLPGETPPPPPKPEVTPKPQPVEKVAQKEPKKTAPMTLKRRKRFWTWIAAGGAGVLAVSAVIMGLAAQSKYDDLDSSCGKTRSCTDDQVDSVKTRAIATDILMASAIAAGVTATVLYFLEGKGASAGSMDDEGEKGLGDDEEEDGDLVRVLKGVKMAPLVGGGTVGAGAVFRF
jgi:hypothetical protein